MSENDENDVEEGQKEIMEAAMTPPVNTSSETPSLTTYAYRDSVENLFSQLTNLSPENIFHEPMCSICSSPYREDIEKKYLDTKKYADVKEEFKGKISISKAALSNHMRFHHDQGTREIIKNEYANKIRRLNSVELTTLDRIRLGLSALTERLSGINSIVPGADICIAEIEKIKSVETARLMTSFNHLLKLQASIMGEMKSNGELIVIPRASFIHMFNEALTEASTDKEKEIIQKILARLAELSKLTQ